MAHVRDQLEEDECQAVGEEALGLLPQKYKDLLKVARPIAYYFQVALAFRSPHTEPQAKQVAFFVEGHLKDSFRIRGHACHVIAEASPERKAQYRNYQRALEILEAKLDGFKDKVRPCKRTLKLHWRDDGKVLGRTPMGSNVWRWEADVLRQTGLALADVTV